MRVAAPVLSRLANCDDADPLRLEPDVDFAFVPAGRPIPRAADVVMLFGTKSTIGDLAFLGAQGRDHDILAHVRAGGRVVGVCGGLQMLGRRVHDPAGADGARSADGLVEGTYLHGLFANDAHRRGWLERVGEGAVSSLQYEAAVDGALDSVADTLSAAVDLDALFGAARRPSMATGPTA